MYVCMYVCMSVCMYVCINMYMYVLSKAIDLQVNQSTLFKGDSYILF